MRWRLRWYRWKAWAWVQLAWVKWYWRAFWHRRRCRACCLFSLPKVASFERNKDSGVSKAVF